MSIKGKGAMGGGNRKGCRPETGTGRRCPIGLGGPADSLGAGVPPSYLEGARGMETWVLTCLLMLLLDAPSIRTRTKTRGTPPGHRGFLTPRKAPQTALGRRLASLRVGGGCC